MQDIQIHTLNNGIRIVYKQISHSKVSHCGIMLDIGSRDESPEQLGLAHFWEHMAFKGTNKRKSFHILNSLESVGGEINAYTTKEKICFYASILDIYLERAIDVLSDITFNSNFPDKQLEVERGVILEEMAMYLDSPEDLIQDELDTMIFPNHPLGENILGTSQQIKKFTRTDFSKFIQKNLDTDRIVFSVVTQLNFDKVWRWAQKYLAVIPHAKSAKKRKAPTEYHKQEQYLKKGFNQAQVALGCPSYSIYDTKRLPFYALVNLLGGPGMNSRFNLTLREKYGLVYSIEANFTSYVDTGQFGIYFGTDPKHLNKALHLVFKQLELLKSKSLGTFQIKSLKEQLKGQLAMTEESSQSFMLLMAKSVLDIDRVESLQEIFQEIDELNAPRLIELANEMFDCKELSILVYN